MPSAYAQLLERVRRMGALHGAAEMLAWDQQVMMPLGGTEGRAAHMAALSACAHELLVAPETGRLLATAEREEKDPDHQAVLRETRFAYDRATHVPMDLVEALSRAQSRGYEAWVEAKKGSDFARFRPHLEELVELRRRYAEHVDPGRPTYEVLFQDYEPWISIADTRRNLAELRDGLRPLVARARSREAARPATFEGAWPAEAQDGLARKVVALLGYDFARGRLDKSPHPFSAGNPFDARITTRYEERDPTGGLLAAIHEAGHAMYMQGLPAERHGTPLGEARDMAVHESQSRLWENHVGRSREFWGRILPLLHESFPRSRTITADDAWRAVNHVEPSLIRVHADELTYHVHIGLRFELEEGLMTGKLAVSEVPHRWNEAMQRDLGLAPPDDARGCLQDVHWSSGSFGYFPTYSLGSILSAQLMEAYRRAGGDATDYGALLGWLRENVHRHGKRHKTGELIERATGSPLSSKAFLRYAGEKYGALWAA